MNNTTIPSYEVTSDDKLWGLLIYILNPIVPIIVLFMEDKKNRPFKAHNAQALGFFVVTFVISFVLSFIFVGCITAVATVVLSILYAVKAYQGNVFDIPVITDFVKKQGWA